MAAALALSQRGRGRTWPNPNVGCLIVRDGRIVGRGWTQPGGRPHAEAMALEAAGALVQGATVYVTLEPCAHQSARGPACADSLIAAGPARVVAALIDPDPRTAGQGLARLNAAGIVAEHGLLAAEAGRAMAGFLTHQRLGRPHVTLKLALSLDGCIAMAGGSSRWITGPAARAHTHLERALHDAILVGAGTVKADAPRLDVRLPGLEQRSPMRVMLGRSPAPPGWMQLSAPGDIAALDCNSLLVEGGAATASAFVQAGLADRLLLYRAPILIGGGTAALGDIGLGSLADAHGQWRLVDARTLPASGPNPLEADRLEVYEAACSQALSPTSA